MADDTNPAPESTTGAEDPNETAGEPSIDERVAKADANAAEAKDRMLRTLAEMENLRRRTEREISDAKTYAVASFAREMLTVADNLKRAIAAVPPEARSADAALSNLMEGVEATERGLEQTLTRFGVKAIEAKGQKFDPQKHQAMYEVENRDMPAGMVAEVVQGGYAIGERVLRPAMVAVSKGAPKAPAGEGGN
ncbi:MAG: nucleotide exchange factor GrpE [Rhizobiales bacterium]|nr:nucleotide exchange factor GrpE [Hyphomicrobiales bacterium]MBN9010615.1 nucleotide exchange factor GrpE [Hyphomicrobiales bacterium]